MPADAPLWVPSPERIAETAVPKFIRALEGQYKVTLGDSDGLYRFSVEESAKFWNAIWDLAGLPGSKGDGDIISDPEDMRKARFFDSAEVNFAEAMLRRRDDGIAVYFKCEDKPVRTLSWGELYRKSAAMARALAALGVQQGDRVAAYAPNMPETIIGFLATAALGAIWTSCSPDFGSAGVQDRFGQCRPKILIAADGYFYNGKEFDIGDKITALSDNTPSIENIIIIPFIREHAELPKTNEKCYDFYALLKQYDSDEEIKFHRLPFNAPQFILYSSGTTGKPKCIVHGCGGTLLKLISEHRLQCDIKGDDRVFFFTTCGWMMWNWLIGVAAGQASIVLYEGSPFYPNENSLWDYAAEVRVSHFGTSAKYLDALANSGAKPAASHDLPDLRCIMTTGSPLLPEQFDYIYRDIKQDVHLASISGGTDIMGLFVGGDPSKPVYRGEIQAPAYGMAIEVFDDDGKPLETGRGELVCTRPFPSRPVKFWGDEDGEKYRKAYYDKFPNVWHHGDFIEKTAHGGYIIHGRSDATLNPGGVRIGTAEIYAATETLPEVEEAIVVGQTWEGDVRVILFVRLREDVRLDEALRDTIKANIKKNCSPRHVPAKIIAVSDIPRTRSGKITELAVRDVIHGKAIHNKTALANPEALKLFENLEALKS